MLSATDAVRDQRAFALHFTCHLVHFGLCSLRRMYTCRRWVRSAPEPRCQPGPPGPICPLLTSPRLSSANRSAPSFDTPEAAGRSPEVRHATVTAIGAGFAKCTPAAAGGLRAHVPARPGCTTPHIRFFVHRPAALGSASFGQPLAVMPLAVSPAFGSAKTWLADSHPHSYVPCSAHTLRITGPQQRRAAALLWAVLMRWLQRALHHQACSPRA
jgi:hypothetical protein